MGLSRKIGGVDVKWVVGMAISLSAAVGTWYVNAYRVDVTEGKVKEIEMVVRVQAQDIPLIKRDLTIMNDTLDDVRSEQKEQRAVMQQVNIRLAEILYEMKGKRTR